ncbi:MULTISPECIES: hypothetical protein [unclassified Clostridioides]|uniref:hypothetical protein n=1 Tax=unclassified Clostridioides TaxID=2635829 RepID=UPI001D129D3C|nr:hypothetical protein [Clostridioides sp. ES-S-0145-01]MCC0681842.1 hypothetical protein [Clostridioides sp. ES-S-0005-03]MCC0709260.1 hypothetical protein [Clostridioides sp. ES-S-0190-01]UDN64039.1 hypothetical protein IC758_20845 [Clostridioides sp. ES-W-0016-02]
MLSYKICVEAVKNNGLALEFIKKQTPERCLEAVRKNGLIVRFVTEQTDIVCKESLKQNRGSIKYIKDKDRYLDEFGVGYLEAQGNTREVFVIKKNGQWLFTIGCQNNITKEEFIYRIYNTDGGFDLEKGVNVHRKIYLDFLKQF